MKAICGIYKIVSIVKPNRAYYGSAVNIKRRWSDHLRELRKGNHLNNKLQNHYNKYGEDDLVFSVVYEYGFKDVDYIREIEEGFIKDFNPYFNICKSTTRSRAGLKNSALHKERISQGQLKEEIRKRQSERMKGDKNPNFGKPQPEEVRLKISQKLKEYFATEKGREQTEKSNDRNKNNKYHSGHRHTPETKAKMSAAKKGRRWSKEQREAHKDSCKPHKGGFPKGHIPWNKGKECDYNEETRRKLGRAGKGRVPWNKGKKFGPQSEELRKKRGAAIKKALALKKQLNKAA